MIPVTAAGEDVGGGDDLAEAEAADKQRDGSCELSDCEGEAAKAGAGAECSAKDAVTELARDGDAAEEGSAEFCEEEGAALGVGEVPVGGDEGEDGAEDGCAESCEEETYGEPEGRGAGFSGDAANVQCLLLFTVAAPELGSTLEERGARVRIAEMPGDRDEVRRWG